MTHSHATHAHPDLHLGPMRSKAQRDEALGLETAAVRAELRDFVADLRRQLAELKLMDSPNGEAGNGGV